MVERGGIEIRYTARYRGFKSLSLRGFVVLNNRRNKKIKDFFLFPIDTFSKIK